MRQIHQKDLILFVVFTITNTGQAGLATNPILPGTSSQAQSNWMMSICETSLGLSTDLFSRIQVQA